MKKILIGFLGFILLSGGYLIYKKDDIMNFIDDKVASAKKAYGDLLAIEEDISKEVGAPVFINVSVNHTDGVTKKTFTVNVKGETKKSVDEIKKATKRSLASNDTFKETFDEFTVQVTFNQEDEDDQKSDF